MQNYSLTHVRDAALLRDLAALVARDRVTTAMLLAHIAEVDARRLYVPAGYSSMHAYCVDELRLSEDAAYKRIRAARAARQFPALFTALAEGRLHLAAVSLLAPHLMQENVEELIAAATHRGKSQIEELLARRFGSPEVPARVGAVPAVPSLSIAQLAPGRVGNDLSVEVGPSTVGSLASAQVEGPQPDLVPTSAERFLVQLTIEKSTRDKLRHAQALLSHVVPNGDVAQVLDRALDALITQLEKRKLGAASRGPRRRRSTAGNNPCAGGRYIPASVRRSVWERDRGECTFVSAAGHRCGARRFLEFDHVDPVARGGQATVDCIRLRCRAHNQYEAERAFGADFMNRKRHEARLAAGKPRTRAAGTAAAAATRDRAQSREVLAGLRALGCRANEARRAVEFAETLRGDTLAERMRAALMFLGRSQARL